MYNYEQSSLPFIARIVLFVHMRIIMLKVLPECSHIAAKSEQLFQLWNMIRKMTSPTWNLTFNEH